MSTLLRNQTIGEFKTTYCPDETPRTHIGHIEGVIVAVAIAVKHVACRLAAGERFTIRRGPDMSSALSLSFVYFAIAVHGSDGANPLLTSDREERIQLAMLIAFATLCLVAWLLAPAPSAERPAASEPNEATRRQRMKARR